MHQQQMLDARVDDLPPGARPMPDRPEDWADDRLDGLISDRDFRRRCLSRGIGDRGRRRLLADREERRQRDVRFPNLGVPANRDAYEVAVGRMPEEVYFTRWGETGQARVVAADRLVQAREVCAQVAEAVAETFPCEANQVAAEEGRRRLQGTARDRVVGRAVAFLRRVASPVRAVVARRRRSTRSDRRTPRARRSGNAGRDDGGPADPDPDPPVRQETPEESRVADDCWRLAGEAWERHGREVLP